ncbi:iroquois homeobox 7 [Anaeramoeba ignava]|uniref:Iroquois homeobox 7 n=1 Tax=Anaeramoeba ignava TaxID=1746090 RepID=A0A9Q0RF51_ANAIG|nr:iroquois homeobox 7 [Anaeramoeba ignava]
MENQKELNQMEICDDFFNSIPDILPEELFKFENANENEIENEIENSQNKTNQEKQSLNNNNNTFQNVLEKSPETIIEENFTHLIPLLSNILKQSQFLQKSKNSFLKNPYQNHFQNSSSKNSQNLIAKLKQIKTNFNQKIQELQNQLEKKLENTFSSNKLFFEHLESFVQEEKHLANLHIDCVAENLDNEIEEISKSLEMEKEKTPKKIKINSQALKSRIGIEERTILEEWFSKNENKANGPYPDKEEKEFLAQLCKVSVCKISTWFGNKRRRIKKLVLENRIECPNWLLLDEFQEGEEEEEENFVEYLKQK